MRKSFPPPPPLGGIGEPGSPDHAPRADDRADEAVIRTEFAFTLPRGYVDPSGRVHRDGVMRLATARDELVPLHDDRVRENPAYLTVVLLARVITRIGTVEDIHAGVIEDLFAADLAFLQELYKRVNTEGHTKAMVTCPSCHHEITVDLAGGRLGES
jgi:hypothetical protein